MAKTIKMIVEIDVSDADDDSIKNITDEFVRDVLPYYNDGLAAAYSSLPTTVYLEVVTKYE